MGSGAPSRFDVVGSGAPSRFDVVRSGGRTRGPALRTGLILWAAPSGRMPRSRVRRKVCWPQTWAGGDMPHTSNRVEAAEGKARGIGPSGAEHSPAQGATLGNRRPPARSHKFTNSRDVYKLQAQGVTLGKPTLARPIPGNFHGDRPIPRFLGVVPYDSERAHINACEPRRFGSRPIIVRKGLELQPHPAILRILQGRPPPNKGTRSAFDPLAERMTKRRTANPNKDAGIGRKEVRQQIQRPASVGGWPRRGAFPLWRLR